MLEKELIKEANSFLSSTREGKQLLSSVKEKGVKSAVPKLKTFTISGLIVDSLTSDPLGGVDITIIGGILLIIWHATEGEKKKNRFGPPIKFKK